LISTEQELLVFDPETSLVPPARPLFIPKLVTMHAVVHISMDRFRIASFPECVVAGPPLPRNLRISTGADDLNQALLLILWTYNEMEVKLFLRLLQKAAAAA
jgi:hypothetical protein